jgi:signal transduction histidine kinase/tetratricopeptide (TPR) repeat protein
MKVIILFFTLLISVLAHAGENEHIKLLEEKKLKCEGILATFSGKPESLDLLIKEGREGLKIAGEKDYEYRYAFHQAIGTGYYYKQDFKSAKEQFEQSYAVAIKGAMTDKSLKPLGHLVSINYYMGLPKEADEAAEKLKNAIEPISDPKLKADAYYNLGLYNQQQKFYYGIALDYFLKSVEAYKPIADTTTIVKLKVDYGIRLMMVAEIYLYLKQPEKALQYLNQAKPTLGLSLISDITAYGKFVKCYMLLKNQTEALRYYNLLHETAAKTDGNWSQLVSSSLLMASLALEEKQFALAKMYLDKASMQAKKDNREIMTSAVYLTYGDYYKGLKDYKNASRYYKMSEHGSALYSKEQYLELLQSLTTVEMLAGNPSDAATYHEKYVSLSDSLTSSKISLNLAEMEARFQNKEKQLRIDNQIAELSYARNQRLWLGAGFLLISLVAILLTVNYRNKKRTADLLDKKNEELTRVNNELEEANQTKAKLFGIISHDLRSPINQVYQFLKLQQRNPQLLNDAQRAELSDKIQSATGSLLETMEELLLWSKSQMSQFKTDIKPVDLKEATNQAVQLIQLDIEAKRIAINNEISAEVWVKADPYYLQTIIRNLLQNAVKSSPAGGIIDIRCIYVETSAVLLIGNTGSEFTSDQYAQVLASTNHGLSGLGLKLVDELSRKTGIAVSFENPERDSTTVSLTFAN